jgi:hypothetical protein
MARYPIPEQMRSFAELKVALDDLPDQAMGDPIAICQIGKPYIEFLHRGLARPGDEEVIEREVVAAMVRSLNEYLGDKQGTIYWRERLEADVHPIAVVRYYDINGPDLDPTTNRRCVTDKNWVRIAAYCRLVRAEFKTMARGDVSAKAA